MQSDPGPWYSTLTMDKVPSPTKLLSDLNLEARLAAAMAKAGVRDQVRLEPSFVHQDWYDVSGLKVVTPNYSVRMRAAAWVRKALVAAGVKQWHTGARQGPCVMGSPEILDTRCYGKDVTLVQLITCSIGD